ncbi:hypothetical protein BS50DRAFT_378663 [Corynespora cassiicola Philippines]|uniref:Uncharacterized protein n=1 Tax=Corynespora cassiicola Philippines TaxID=1448308 RepID=A0A2T2NPE0_CORCC|nr:hypothetical protein BS50DRAFT_378663 [Corynespora cassiicola Philippines]
MPRLWRSRSKILIGIRDHAANNSTLLSNRLPSTWYFPVFSPIDCRCLNYYPNICFIDMTHGLSFYGLCSEFWLLFDFESSRYLGKPPVPRLIHRSLEYELFGMTTWPLSIIQFRSGVEYAKSSVNLHYGMDGLLAAEGPSTTRFGCYVSIHDTNNDRVHVQFTRSSPSLVKRKLVRCFLMELGNTSAL